MTNRFVKTLTDKIENGSVTAAQRIIEILEELGVDTVFGYPGAAVLPLYNSLIDSTKIKHILCRHEQGAVHAAEGYAKIKQKSGVVFVTSGPGFSNTLTGILNANTDKTPLVIITGQVENLNNNEFQSVDIENISKSCAKSYFSVDNSACLESTLHKAFEISQHVPCGPVVISVPRSVLEANANEVLPYKARKEIKVEAPQSCVLKAIDTLRNAKRPVIIVGGGCTNLSKEIEEISHLTHIPVVNTMMGKNSSDNISLGMIGQCGDSSLNEFVNNSDVALTLGVRFTNRTTNNTSRFLPNSKIININIEENISDNVCIEQELIGELEVILQQMIGTMKSKNILFDIKYDWIESIPQLKHDFETSFDKLNLNYVLELINSYVRKFNPIITTDVGEHQIAAAKIFKMKSEKKFLTSGGFGVMGFGLPSAIGAHFASPNSLVINITGDGSFQMNMQELGTIAEYNIPLKIFIMNNSSLGMVETTQKSMYGRINQSSLINPDFTKIGESYGIKSYSIWNETELERALKEIFMYKKAVLLDIHI